MNEQPSAREVEALRAIHQEHRSAGAFVLLSVNTDPADRLPAAQAFVKQQNYDWPQTFERRTDGSQFTQPFSLESLPIQVLIDRYGYVRAVGQADEPALRYAVRAAVAEARGTYGVVMPKTTDGTAAKVPAAEREAATVENRPGARTAPEGPAAPAREELRNDPDARKLLDQARVYLKTGRKRDAKKILEEVVAKYPGTYEAQTAQEYLWSLD